MQQNEIRAIADRKKPHVQLSGMDGNAFAIMRRARAAMRECGWTNAEIAEATDSMMVGNYDDLLQVVCTYCTVD